MLSASETVILHYSQPYSTPTWNMFNCHTNSFVALRVKEIKNTSSEWIRIVLHSAIYFHDYQTKQSQQFNQLEILHSMLRYSSFSNMHYLSALSRCRDMTSLLSARFMQNNLFRARLQGCRWVETGVRIKDFCAIFRCNAKH